MSPWIRIPLALILLAFGLACLNYTKQDTHEDHVAWAIEQGLPEPSPGLFRAGVAGTVIGSFLLGRNRAKSRRR